MSVIRDAVSGVLGCGGVCVCVNRFLVGTTYEWLFMGINDRGERVMYQCLVGDMYHCLVKDINHKGGLPFSALAVIAQKKK